MTDGRGVPLGLTISAANVNDVKMALPTVDSVAEVTPSRRFRPTHCAGDKGYDAGWLEVALRSRGIVPHIRKRGEGPLLGFYFGKPRRWVVERTNSWHNRFRALLIRWERRAENYLGLCQLGCALITLQQALRGTSLFWF